MKRSITAIGVLLLLVIGMLAVPSSALLTWETYLEEIQVNSGTTNFSLTYYFNETGTSGNYTNITLPCNVGNLTAASTTFSIHALVNQTFNLTANGNKVNITSMVNWTVGQNWSNTTLTEWIAADGNITGTTTYLNLTFDTNLSDPVDGNTIEINIVAENAAFLSAWLETQVVVTEALLSMPEIKDSQAHSFFAVRDKIRVNNSMNYTLTDISLNLTYASQNISDTEANYTIATMAASDINNHTVNYSKYGPYVFGKPSEDIDGDEHDVRIQVKSHEVLSRVVDWSFYPTAEDYEDYFETIDYDTLVIKLNNVKLDWEEGTIEMEDMTLRNTTNIFKFTWTEAEAPPVPAVPGPWDWLFEDYGTGIALWMWFVITAVVIGVIAIVAYTLRKK